MATTTKTEYHPMLMFLYYAGCLDERIVKQIPATTLQYWKTKDHTTLYGYEHVKDICSDFQKFEFLTKKSIAQQALRITARIVNTFAQMYTNTMGYKKIAAKNAKQIIETIDNIKPHVKLQSACRMFNISLQQYYRWKNKINCTASVLNICFKTHPSQLSMNECVVIEESLKGAENANKPKLTIYYNLLRKGSLFCGVSTFYKYAKFYDKRHVLVKYEKPINNFRASQPFEYLHIDTTKVYTEHEGWLRVVFVKDNYSKSLLYKTIVPNAGSIHIREILHNTFEQYDLYSRTMPIQVVCDDGSENKGEVTTWLNLLKKKNVVRVIAQKDSNISNNMVESCNSQFKNVYMPTKKLPWAKRDSNPRPQP